MKRPKGKGHNGWEKQANSALAKLRAPVEHAFAELKRWRVLDLVRISPNRITAVLHALLVITQKRSSLARG
ncbi:transposase family protein [Streptomyces chengmaiensis]|uniref:transposase family protein n=1 Tax=Streptomyces chengmaiensis TaxID=3040919 RepID=UPI0037DA1B53